MCGVCGYAGTHQPELLKRMSDAIAHRGPDDAGIWCDETAQIGLAHRRLSIIDVSPAGHQPMANDDGSILISYNGEIYNFQEFYDDLKARGYRFRSKSDTEVLLYLYEEYGIEFLQKLNGIFALAIWDARKRQLLLVRDHAGVKPLYYWQSGERLYFASEIKALLKIPDIPREVNYGALPSYLSLLWVPGRETMLEGINKLEPGEYLLWQDGRVDVRQWFSLTYEPDETVAEAEWVERVHDTFMGATRRQMVSDVPLGAFLSGGLDSSSIVACMRRSFPDRDITCYTMAYDPKDLVREGVEDDYPYAKRVAGHLGVNMKSLVLEPDCVNLLPKIVYHMDEPDADPTAIATYIVSKMAHDDGTTVLLTGTGGDEVFFGYRSHQAYRLFERLDRFPRWLAEPALSTADGLFSRLQGAQGALPRRLRKFGSALFSSGLDRHLALVDWSDHATRSTLFSQDLKQRLVELDHTPSPLRKYFDQFQGKGEINRHSHVLIQTFLAAHNFLYTDKCGMATSVENRVPFMDIELLRLCAAIPERFKLKGSETKYLLKKAMERYLPAEIIRRGKTGFSPPLREWIINGLDPMIQEFLSSERLARRGLFVPGEVQTILDENRLNKRDHGYLIYAMLNLEIWLQTFVDRPGLTTNNGRE